MKFTRELPGTLTIRGVGEDGIRINDELLTGTIAVTPQEVISDWSPTPVSELTSADLEPVLKHSPELVIIGTGVSGAFAPRELMFEFARLGVGLEVMDTAAAARTFNVLAGEGRRVAAVLYQLP